MILFFATLLVSLGWTSPAYLLGAAAGCYFTIKGFALSRGRHVSRTTPVARLEKSTLGPVEVSGIAAGPVTILSPITETACFGCRTVAWRQKSSGDRHSEEIIAEEIRHVPFYLDDSTGKVLIDPSGAEFDLRQDFRHEFRDAARASENPGLRKVRNFLARHGIFDYANLRIEEFCIKPKGFLFIRGKLAKNPGLVVEAPPSPEADLPPLEAMLGAFHPFGSEFPAIPKVKGEEPNATAASFSAELAGVTPAPSTNENPPLPMTQQGMIAAALERAGILMPDIYSLLKEGDGADELQMESSTPDQLADRLLGSEKEKERGNGQENGGRPSTKGEFDLKPAVVLMKDGNSNFVISWREQRNPVGPLPGKVGLLLWGGLALTLACLSLLAAQLGWL